MKIMHLAGMNLRQAMFHAAGWSECDRPELVGIRVHLYGVVTGAGVEFYMTRDPSKRPDIPLDNAVRVATFMFGDTESQAFPLHEERDLWPEYPWLDVDVARERKKQRV